jgi:peptidase S41-like protein
MSSWSLVVSQSCGLAVGALASGHGLDAWSWRRCCDRFATSLHPMRQAPVPFAHSLRRLTLPRSIRVGACAVIDFRHRCYLAGASPQLQIGALDSAGACGWVVDLRQNTGGNMWPMLAGVGPLLGAEVVGSFTNSPPGEGWHYRDGRSWSGNSTQPPETLGWGSVPPRRIRNPAAPVALLVGRETASSGEMTLLAFLGRPHVRSFGDSTAGYTSSNTNVPLRDGTTLIVTSSYPRDRSGGLTPSSRVRTNSCRATARETTFRSAARWRGCGSSQPARNASDRGTGPAYSRPTRVAGGKGPTMFLAYSPALAALHQNLGVRRPHKRSSCRS